MRRSIVISLLIFAAFSGCNSKDNSAKSQDEHGGPPESWLNVLSTPADLKQAQELAEQLDHERLEAMLGRLDEAFIGLEEIRLLRAHEDEVRRRLRPLIDQRDVTPSIAAAVVLCQLGDFSGLPHLVSALENGSDEERIKALHELNYSLVEILKAHNDQRLQQVLLAQLDHANPEVVKAAIQACGRMEVPGATEKFAELLESANPPDPGRLCYWLSRLDPQPEYLRPVIGSLGDENPPLDHWTIVALSHFADSDNPDARQAARSHLRKIVDAKLPQITNRGRLIPSGISWKMPSMRLSDTQQRTKWHG